MPLAIGSRLGPYEITGTLGAGGMGEVYRARDAKLGRDVALKILPTAFAADPDRLARFQREAQVLASLNHPHIGAIYGFEDSGETHALVLELVEGETLADRIIRGRLSLDEAVPIARQIADALAAAHEQGIIHRDLKPANIKITPDGVVKVLDFGLAKLTGLPEGGHYVRGALDPDVRSVRLQPDLSPTITSPAMMTGVGVLLGTAAYMSPEQAKGHEADKRSDIWAFGCVLYELLTARRPFDGEGMTEVLGAVVRLEPNWEALPSDVPQPVRTLLQRCLVKDRRKRIGDIAAALFVLDHEAGIAANSTASAAPPTHRPLWRRMTALTAGALVVAIVTGAVVWFATRRAAPVPPPVSRLLATTTGSAALSGNFAITPDGSRVIYVGNRGTQLFVRAMDSLEPVAVFTGEPSGPFVSPDGQWIGFVDRANSLKRVAITGGAAVPLGTVASGSRLLGATWGPDDTIIVGTENVMTGLQRLGAAGTATTVLTQPDRARGELFHVWPELLPGGRAVLFTIMALTGGLDAAQVVVLDLQTGSRKLLVSGGSDAHYVSSGHLVYYTAAGTLRAMPFDLDRLETHDPSVQVVPEVMWTGGGAYAAVTGDGTLAYVPDISLPGNTLVWVDREGRETPISAPPRAYLYPRLSPEGTHVAMRALDAERDIWVWDLTRPTLTRVTSDSGFDGHALWTRGDRLIFSSDREGVRNLFAKSADGTGAIEQLTEGPNTKYATAVSPEGRLIFTEESPKTNDDVMEMQLDGTRSVRPLLQSSFNERNGVVSPDGRWLAYEADDSGRFEVFVRPFPQVNSGVRSHVSTTGGTRPLWAPNGRELFYVSLAGALMRVGVGAGTSWTATTPTLLIREGYLTVPDRSDGRTYDIEANGKRFLMIKQGKGSNEIATPPGIIIVHHWGEELKRLVPIR